MRHHYLHNWCRGDTEGSPGSCGATEDESTTTSDTLVKKKINFNHWSCFIISKCFNIMNPIFKFRGHQKSGSPREALSSHIQVIPQSFDTTPRRPKGSFAAHALLCGAQSLMGDPKMTRKEHFVRSPHRCLKSFQSSPS